VTLAEDLRDYIERIVEPVSIADITNLDELSPAAPRRRRSRLVIAAVVTLLICATAVLLLRSGDDSSSIRPTDAGPMALTASGPADCSRLSRFNVISAVTLSNGHEVCIVRDGAGAAVYFDGVKSLGGSGDLATGSIAGGVGLVGNEFIFGASMPDNADAIRFTMCDGRSVVTRPISGQPPRFAFAQIPVGHGSDPAPVKSTQLLDANLDPIGPSNTLSPCTTART
jgi:hypothetical protein